LATKLSADLCDRYNFVCSFTHIMNGNAAWTAGSSPAVTRHGRFTP
jgi:hypothetical protein